MKKLLSLLLLAALMIGLLTACGETSAPTATPRPTSAETAAPSPEPAPAATETPAPTETPSFADSIEAQAFSVAMAYHEGSFTAGTTPQDPDLLWEITGWYAAWLHRVQGTDLLSESEVKDFQRSIGGGDTLVMSVEWLIAVHDIHILRSSDGAVSYTFPTHLSRLEELLGVTMEWELDASAPPEAVVVLRQHYAANASAERRYELSFIRNREAGSAFAYSLRNAVIEEPGPWVDPELDFDWDGLIAANSLKNILSLYPSVKIRQTYDNGIPTWVFERNGNLCILRGPEEHIVGQYRGCYFEYARGVDGQLRAVISGFGPDAANPEVRDTYISDYLNGAAIIKLDRIDGDLIRTHVDYKGDWQQDIAFDRGTLVLREMVHRIDEETEPIVNTFTYDEQPPAFSFLDSWDRPLRHVTLVWEDYYNGGPHVRRETVELPMDWEYLPDEGRGGDYTVYMNEGYTQLYFYPGDNIDYTLYLTTAKG